MIWTLPLARLIRAYVSYVPSHIIYLFACVRHHLFVTGGWVDLRHEQFT